MAVRSPDPGSTTAPPFTANFLIREPSGPTDVFLRNNVTTDNYIPNDFPNDFDDFDLDFFDDFSSFGIPPNLSIDFTFCKTMRNTRNREIQLQKIIQQAKCARLNF